MRSLGHHQSGATATQHGSGHVQDDVQDVTKVPSHPTTDQKVSAGASMHRRSSDSRVEALVGVHVDGKPGPISRLASAALWPEILAMASDDSRNLFKRVHSLDQTLLGT